MPLPPLTQIGDLPAGVHRATLQEVLDRFGGGSLQRAVVARRLERIYGLVRGTAHLARFVVFGSFVTATPGPHDVDVFLVMADEFERSAVQGEASLVFDHAVADAYFGASVFWVRRHAALGGVDAAVEYWQLKRGGGQRGIVEIVEEAP
jgi:hypothetical protein